MLVFISDLHMDDTGSSGCVSDAYLFGFLERLERQYLVAGKKIILVFLGDVLELLRSPKWEELWKAKNKSAPWSGMGPRFGNFNGGHAEAVAVDIARTICGRYPQFSTKLKALVSGGSLETRYIYGNHDYMVQLSEELRKILVGFLSLPHDPKKPFPLTFSDGESSTYATHGHSVDAVNWHRAEEGYWALGDAVVLRVVNRFAALACERLGLALSTVTGRLLQELDNVEPMIDIPVYVRWLAERSLTIKTHRETVEQTWKDVVNDFLSIPEFHDRGYSDGPFKMLRTAFELSTHISLTEMFTKYSAIFQTGGGSNYREEALRLSRQHPQYRFILFGHTHGPMFVPISSDGGRSSFYVNTGCWRRVLTRTSRDEDGSFVGRRMTTYFVVDDSDMSPERYHFHQEWHTI
jgi:UDP-2,3-diacylglucosamine pyrophosphatase LpxH